MNGNASCTRWCRPDLEERGQLSVQMKGGMLREVDMGPEGDVSVVFMQCAVL